MILNEFFHDTNADSYIVSFSLRRSYIKNFLMIVCDTIKYPSRGKPYRNFVIKDICVSHELILNTYII